MALDELKGNFWDGLDIFWDIIWDTYIDSYWLKMDPAKI